MEAKLFEVDLRNRVVSGFKEKPIKGTQGRWHQEAIPCLAESQGEAEEFAFRKVKARKILGIPRNTKRRGLKRKIEVLNTRRLA